MRPSTELVYECTVPLFTRRCSFVLPLLPILLVAACSSSEPSPNGGAPPAVVDGTPDGGAPTDGTREVRIRSIHRFGHESGNITEVAAAEDDWVSGAAIVSVDGNERVIPGTVQPDGSIVISGVPRGPWVLELRERASGDAPPVVLQYPVDGVDVVRLGSDYWARKDVVPMAPATKLALTASAPAGFVTGDTFSWLGVRSYFYREVEYAPEVQPEEGQVNVPAEDATSSTAWTINGDVLDQPYGPEASGLPAAGDDLKIVQSRRQRVTLEGDRFDPWTFPRRTDAIGVLDAASVSFVNGTTNTITGTLTPPATQSLTVDVGARYATIRDDAGYPKATRASATLRMYQEAGQGPGFFTSLGPVSWSLDAQSVVKPRPEFPQCFPEAAGARCDPSACDVPCDEATDGYIDPGSFRHLFDVPRLYASGMRDVYDVSYTYFLAVSLPDGSSATLSAAASTTRVLTGSKVAFELELGPVRNLRFDGKALPWDGGEPLASPPQTISFEPPSHGTPEYYDVKLRELGAESRVAARIYTRQTSVKIPADVLRRGRSYHVIVDAVRDGRDFSQPALHKSDAIDRTGVFSPLFSIVE